MMGDDLAKSPHMANIGGSVYHDVPRHLQEQWQQVRELVAKHPEEYSYLKDKRH